MLGMERTPLSEAWRRDGATAEAAMTLCESILLFLVEKGLASADEITHLVEDAASFHRQEAVERPQETVIHELAANLIEKMIKGNNITSPR
jgi:hypothetical protein